MEPYAERDYDPIQPRGTNWRGVARKVFAPVLFLLGLGAKLGFLVKFAAIFVAFAGYTLIWGWKFALGVIVTEVNQHFLLELTLLDATGNLVYTASDTVIAFTPAARWMAVVDARMHA